MVAERRAQGLDRRLHSRRMVTICVCRGTARSEAIALMDEVFIRSRGRSMSLADRFPAAFDARETTILAIRSGSTVDAALTIRPFSWLSGGGVRRGAMVGMVCTRLERRGAGLGLALMSEATRMLKETVDFGVLWTTRPAFYGRLGWHSADCGIMGSLHGAGGSPPMAPSEARNRIAGVKRLRDAQDGERIERTPLCYATLLPPASIREVLLESGTYAVIGRDNDTAYVYEIGGDATGLTRLHERLCERYGDIHLNLKRGAAAHRWFRAQPDITWYDQNLAMWLPISPDIDMDVCSRWYVPFLDRI